MSLHSRSTIVVFLLTAIVSGGAGAGMHALYLRSHTTSGYATLFGDNADIRQKEVGVSALTNPLLECKELPEAFSIGERLTIEKELEDYVTDAKRKGILVDVGIYFRDLNNGPWFGINEDYKFAPASLLKVPLAMTFYDRAESEPGILQTEIEFAGAETDLNVGQTFHPRQKLEVGHIYTVHDLINLMLTESSNEAALALSQIAGAEQMQKIYEDFGQPIPKIQEDYYIDAHTYASFFRVLYNATYLDKDSSEEILTMLTHSAFDEGIRAGVPATVEVAHKFGERQIEGTKTRRLHDCGIVYAPNKPYIICVMTEGTEYADLANFISTISKKVYEEVVN